MSAIPNAKNFKGQRLNQQSPRITLTYGLKMRISEKSSATALPSICPKQKHNYIAFFLTLACNLKCPYCINHHGGGSRYARAKRDHMTAQDWVAAANRLTLRDDLPLTLQGGEPTLYEGFYTLVNATKPDIKMDLLTNLMFDVEEFIRQVPPSRFLRDAPYAAIRVSYHPGQNDIEDLIKKTLRLQECNFRVGLYSVEHPNPEIHSHILETQAKCVDLGLDFRLKEFLGEYKGKIYGTFKYPNCVMQSEYKTCDCRTSEIIADPAGYVYKCHADLYEGRTPIAHILDPDFSEETIEEFRRCEAYGSCNPCDVKVTTNRFQIFGHTSVEIQNIRES